MLTLTSTDPTIVGAGTFEVIYLNQCWWDSYSIAQVERFATLDDANSAAFQTITDDRENECNSYDCIRIWNRQDNALVKEWIYCCDDADSDGEGGMIGLGYDWHLI